MQKSSANTSEAKLVHRRKWTPKAKAKVLAYAAEHGYRAAMAHYRLSSGLLYTWKHASKQQGNGITKSHYTSTTRILARKLQKESIRRLTSTRVIGDFELTAMLLVKEILS